LDAVWPSHVKLFPDHVEVGMSVTRSYILAAYPREVYPGWFESLLAFSHPLAITFRSAPVDASTASQSVNRRMIWHRGAAEADRVQGRLGRAERQVALDDAERVRIELAKGDLTLLEVSLTVTLWANDVEALDRISRLFESLCHSLMCVPRVLRYQQHLGLRRGLPIGDPPETTREMDSRAWATLFPFSSRDVLHASGQVMGLNPASQSFVIVDRFLLASPHSITIGWSGAGKSFTAKLETLRSRYRGWRVSIVDPEGEYAPLSRAGAAVWKVGQEGQHALPYDPFSLPSTADQEGTRRADFLIRLLHRLSPDLMRQYGPEVQDAVWRTVHARESRFSPNADRDADFTPVLDELGRHSPSARDRLELVYRRWSSVFGSGKPAWAPADGGIEVYDFSQLAEGLKGPAYFALTEWLMRRMDGSRERRLIIFDEAWHLLNDEQSAPYLEELFRRARKWGTALSLLSQDIGDFTRNRAAQVCLRNAPLVLLLRQHPESVAEVAEMLRLNDGEVQIIESAGQGEGLLLMGDAHIPLRVVASPAEARMVQGEDGEKI
jgi:hypothetical protein